MHNSGGEEEIAGSMILARRRNYFGVFKAVFRYTVILIKN